SEWNSLNAAGRHAVPDEYSACERSVGVREEKGDARQSPSVIARKRWLGSAVVAMAILCGSGLRVAAQHAPGHVHGAAEAVAPAVPPSGQMEPRRVKEDELHRHGGVPRGWKFVLPPGSAERGRELFRELECYKCHEIKTEQFPRPS